MTEISNWKKVDIENTHIDGLTLSSPQGNFWQKMMGAIARKFSAVDAKLEKVEGAYVYRGTKATEAALPASGNSVGDVWNVTENGHNYAWNGTAWDDLGGGVRDGGGLAFDENGAMEVDFSQMPQAQINEILSAMKLPIFIDGTNVGTEFYVDGANGNNTTGDGSQSKPWKTINYACSELCSNYNLNSQTVHINVAAGTYGQVNLVPQTRTTGSVVIRPVSGANVKISNTGYAIRHRGGAWVVEDITLELNVPNTASGGAKYIVLSEDSSAGGVTIRHCDLSFIDNAPSGLSPASSLRGLAAQGGRINIENKADALSANWSGDKGNSTVSWLWASSGGIIDVRANSAGYTYNVSGSFTSFVRVQTQGQYTVGGSGQVAVWNYDNTVTGGRYYADGGGTIRTALANASDVAEYFPGNAAGTVVASEGSWISPGLPTGFSSTPAYDVTLAEDATTSNASRYSVTLPARTKAAYLYIIMEQGAANKNGNVFFYWSSGNAAITIPTAVSSSAARRVFARGETGNGLAFAVGGSANSAAGTSDSVVMPSFPSFPTGDMTTVEFYLSGDGVMPSGTRIRVYADLED